jgi:hypothetical protein
MRMDIFSVQDKVKPDNENKRGLNFGGGQAYYRSSD